MYNYEQAGVNLKNTNSFLRKVFVYMALGILFSFAVSFYSYNSPTMLNFITRFFMFLSIAQIGMVLSLNLAINKISSSTARILFFVYSALTGLTLTGIGLMYDPLSILYAFLITFVIFLVTALFGYTTQEDLSSYRRFFMIGLVTLIIIGLINMFIGVGPLYWIGTVLGVVIFSGLIAFDVNRIKHLSYRIADNNGEAIEKMAVIGALSLYLDFINLFLYVIRIFGRRR